MGALDGLDIIMTLAAQEAIAAGYAEITSAHLLIALARAAEANGPLAMPTYTTAIRREFEALGIEPRRFRRRLRVLLGHGEPNTRESPCIARQRAKPSFSMLHRSLWQSMCCAMQVIWYVRYSLSCQKTVGPTG